MEREEARIVGFVRHDVDPVRLIGEARFLKHDADLYSIGRRGGEELQPTGVLRRPARETRMIKRHFLPPGPVGTYRSEEHTSELQSLMRISYAVFCLKKKKQLQP